VSAKERKEGEVGTNDARKTVAAERFTSAAALLVLLGLARKKKFRGDGSSCRRHTRRKRSRRPRGTASPATRLPDGRQWRQPVPQGATARARMGRGVVEAKRVGLGSVATFIGQREG
jgi:hypothetical protein